MKIHICQTKYAVDHLADSGSLGVKPLKLPMDPNLTSSKTTGEPPAVPSICRDAD